MERKGLRVNMAKTKVMKCQLRSGQAEDSGKWPCGVCRKGVGRNSLVCGVCRKWVHKKCSGVKGRLKAFENFSKKFRELAPILTVRGMSLKLKGKIYRACVQSVMVYESETWAMKVSNLQQLERTERTMVRWMCGVAMKDRKLLQDLLDCLNITGVAERVRCGR